MVSLGFLSALGLPQTPINIPRQPPRQEVLLTPENGIVPIENENSLDETPFIGIENDPLYQDQQNFPISSDVEWETEYGTEGNPDELLDTAENIVFRPLFAYRQQVAQRRRVQNLDPNNYPHGGIRREYAIYRPQGRPYPRPSYPYQNVQWAHVA